MKKNIGSKGELYAAHYLQSKGYEIMIRNFYTKFGEIDIVAKKNNKISFVEVKTRTHDYFGSPEESISFIKMNRLKLTIKKFLLNKSIFREWQIDVIAIRLNSFEELVDLRHYKNVEFVK